MIIRIYNLFKDSKNCMFDELNPFFFCKTIKSFYCLLNDFYCCVFFFTWIILKIELKNLKALFNITTDVVDLKYKKFFLLFGSV